MIIAETTNASRGNWRLWVVRKKLNDRLKYSIGGIIIHIETYPKCKTRLGGRAFGVKEKNTYQQGNCSMETKVCTSCNQELPATDEYFHTKKKKNGQRGLREQCKQCRNAIENARYEADKERILEYHRLRYVDNPEPKKAYARQRRIDKPEVVREEQRLYRLNNQDKIKAGKRAWQQANKERKKIQWLAWKAANPEKAKEIQRRYHQRHKSRENARISNYYKQYPEKKLAHRQNRRAREINAEGSFTLTDIYNLWLDQEGRCSYCGRAINYKGKGKFQIDHIVPLSKGGTNYPSNLALCCKHCNLSKHDSDVITWLIRKFL